METQLTIILLSLLLGIASGAIMHRSDFCIAGLFRDLFLFRSSPLLYSLILLIALSMLLFELARLSGWLQLSLPSSLYGLPDLGNLFGGILFGVGMVLAGGCVIGTLYKFGSGSQLAGWALLGLVIGSTLYAEIHPLWAQLGKATQLSDAATLPQLLGLKPTMVHGVVLAGLGGLLLRWQKQGKLTCPSVVRGYLQPRNAAILLAFIGLLSFVLTGMPLGISTSYAKVGAYFEQLLFPEHVASLGYFQTKGFVYFSPLSGQNLAAGAGPFWDGLSLVQFPLISGIVFGSAISALAMGKFRIHHKLPKIQLLSAILGGGLMGLAARMTPACNIWHLIGGVPLLALESLLFCLGLLPGAWLGSYLLCRYVLNDSAARTRL